MSIGFVLTIAFALMQFPSGHSHFHKTTRHMMARDCMRRMLVLVLAKQHGSSSPLSTPLSTQFIVKFLLIIIPGNIEIL